MKGEGYHYNQKKSHEDPPIDPATSVSAEPEKVHVFQTPIAATRTTFYGQQKEDPQPETPVVAAGPEKVHVLETPIAQTHTTFYPQKQAR